MLISLVLLAAVIGSIRLSKVLWGDIFTPLCVYNGFWCFCLWLFSLRIVDYDPLTGRTILMIAGSLATFTLGCCLAGRSANVSAVNPVVIRERFESCLKIVLFLNILGLAVFTFQMSRTYGLATYWLNPAEIRRDAQSWTHTGLALGLLMLLTYPLVVLSIMHRLRWGRWTRYNVAGLVTGIIGAQLSTGRGDLVTYIITGAFLWIYYKGWRTWNRRLLLLTGTLVVASVVYFLAVGAVYGKLVEEGSRIYNTQEFNTTSGTVLLLASPYIYATADFPAFQEASSSTPERTWGARTFFPIARCLYALGITHHLTEWTEMDYYFVPVPMNTYTHLQSFYSDFGVAGVLLLPLALGWIETRLYISMRTRADLFSMGITSAFMAINIFSVFIPLVSNISIWYLAFILWLVRQRCNMATRARIRTVVASRVCG